MKRRNFESVEAEIRKEKDEALGWTGERLERALIQREAVGLWRHEDVDRQYPVPGPLTLSIVTRREESR